MSGLLDRFSRIFGGEAPKDEPDRSAASASIPGRRTEPAGHRQPPRAAEAPAARPAPKPDDDSAKARGAGSGDATRNDRSAKRQGQRDSGAHGPAPDGGNKAATRRSGAAKAARGGSGKAGAGGGKGNGSAKGSGKREAEPARTWKLSEFQVPEEEGKARFHDFDLPLPLMHAIHELGYRYTTPIQAETLPHSLADYDVTGQAQTGTGKTAAFLITIITRILEDDSERKVDAALKTPRALIVAPTRELALQIAADAKDLCRYSDLSVVALVGGMDFDRQRAELERGPVHLLVATPGRLLDFAQRRDVILKEVEVLVLDEADRMLSMGFIPDVKRIIRMLPHKQQRQTLLFSATFTQDILNLASQWTEDAVHVQIEPEHVAVDTVDQRAYMLTAEDKYNVLYNVLSTEAVTRAIVFANRRDQTRRVCERLQRHGIACAMLSGDVPQNRRLRTLERFRRGDIDVLVATDVAGRGIHVEGVSHVINYNLPEDPEDYVHRIGRTGRAGAAGVSISLICEDEALRMMDIEALLGDKLTYQQAPEALLAKPPSIRNVDIPEEDRIKTVSRDRDRGPRSGGRGGPRRR
jgi:ATP-dependent RNA helicase RhlB